MIHDIEEFSPELYLSGLTQPLYRRIFHEREIQVQEARPDQAIPANVPHEPNRREHEGARVEVKARPAEWTTCGYWCNACSG